ncbi:site-specific integrase [Caulobacter hibisci]|uniref:Tyrosine-type recombinase/integrase n=1 Tax=Caulobacter hibisci TaxID=2035993 RepID=A0ABS0T5R5_9CAUL|nr:site-specific integrase [Caulobacter hibisci]MBI1686445.1 tyrosine-type recombinase/integrase [Caulobacter hibisci]
MAGSYTAKLTARTVAAIKPNGDDFDVSDSDIRGFHIRVTKRGKMIYRFQYRRPDNSRPVLTLGTVSELTPDEARRAAHAHFIAVGGGADPRKARQDWIAAPTMDDLWERYERERLKIKNRERTVAEYVRNWKSHAKPLLGGMKVSEVGRKDVNAVVAAMGDKRTTANRVVALLSVMFNFAVENELRADNPAAGVRKHRENRRDVAFTDDELSRIAAAIENERESWAKAALSLMMVTGGRHREILSAEWSEFDLDDSSPSWRLPAQRMKGGKAHTYALDTETVEAIRAWKEDAPFLSPRWVFPNIKGTGPKESLQKPWTRVKAEAKLTRGVLHSFRHTFLTRLAESGASAIDIRNTAGHADIATSMKYVHAAENARLRELQEQNRKGIREAMKKKPTSAQIIPITGKAETA